MDCCGAQRITDWLDMRASQKKVIPDNMLAATGYYSAFTSNTMKKELSILTHSASTLDTAVWHLKRIDTIPSSESDSFYQESSCVM